MQTQTNGICTDDGKRKSTNEQNIIGGLIGIID